VEDPTENAYTKGSTMKFSNVLLNEGDGYDSTTGLFTAPVAGLYLFTAQLCVEKGQSVYIQITKNGTELQRSRVYQSGSNQCCNAEAVDVLSNGDIISLLANNNGVKIQKDKGIIFNTFCGFLLRETE